MEQRALEACGIATSSKGRGAARALQTGDGVICSKGRDWSQELERQVTETRSLEEGDGDKSYRGT